LERPFLLYVGERRPHKNLPGLLEAFMRFRKQSSRDYQLIIAGKRYADYEIPEKITAHLGLERHVRFLDYVPDQNLPFLYQSAEALILISHYEGFGLPVLEAMASGTPVVASNSSSLPEVIGEAGILVPPDDPDQTAEALMMVVIAGELRERCIARGLDQARQFTWERCADKTRAIYREALAI
jgi:glycosyltransferase involved in cell wall biosynthesis